MTPEPAYPAARQIAERVRRHFATEDGGAATVPDVATIERMIDASFWASLRREESYVPKISLAYLKPEQASRALLLENNLPMLPADLAHLSAAVERPGIHLGVSGPADDLYVWGTTRTLPARCLTIEVIAPGLLVVKESRQEDAGKYINVAVIEGDRIKVLDQRAAHMPDCPDLLTSLLGLEPPRSAGDVSVLIQLAISMRAHGRGGSLLVVPAGSGWQESIMRPIPYAVSPPFSELADLLNASAGEKRDLRWQEALHRSVEAIAGLTAVDGATIITDSYQLLAFGAKIGRRDGRPRVEEVLMTEPVEGSEPVVVHPVQLGGTRHLSGAQFALDQHDAIALVASQDGRFTLFAWSPSEQIVQGHGVEALLL